MSNQLPSRQEFDANLIAKAQTDAAFLRPGGCVTT